MNPKNHHKSHVLIRIVLCLTLTSSLMGCEKKEEKSLITETQESASAAISPDETHRDTQKNDEPSITETLATDSIPETASATLPDDETDLLKFQDAMKGYMFNTNGQEVFYNFSFQYPASWNEKIYFEIEMDRMVCCKRISDDELMFRLSITDNPGFFRQDDGQAQEIGQGIDDEYGSTSIYTPVPLELHEGQTANLDDFTKQIQSEAQVILDTFSFTPAR